MVLAFNNYYHDIERFKKYYADLECTSVRIKGKVKVKTDKCDKKIKSDKVGKVIK